MKTGLKLSNRVIMFVVNLQKNLSLQSNLKIIFGTRLFQVQSIKFLVVLIWRKVERQNLGALVQVCIACSTSKVIKLTYVHLLRSGL